MKRHIAILILSFMTMQLFAQKMTVEQIERDLHNTYSNLVPHQPSDNAEWNSIKMKNIIFRNKIGKYTSMYPLTLTYKFDSLRKDNIYIVSSEDKLLRIYSWDTWLGGTMSNYENVFQYKSGNKVYSEVVCDTAKHEGSDYVPFYSQIFTLKTVDKTYYLAVYNGIYSGRDASQSIKIITLENQSLNDTIKLIKTKSGMANSIDVYFDFTSVVDRPERPIRLIKYDSNQKTIYIPIVDEDGDVTDMFILYKFTGQYFEHIETQKIKKN